MKNEITSHRDLRVWQKAAILARECVEFVNMLPEEAADFGKRVRRKAESVPYEIERGFQFQQLAPYLHHLGRAKNRVLALEPLFIEGCGRGWIANEVGDRLLRRTAEIQRMLRKLILSLETASQARRRRAVAK